MRMNLVIVILSTLVLAHTTFGCNQQTNKDIQGNDLISKLGQLSDCCGLCQSTPGCKAYAWNNYQGGTCWLKSATGPIIDKGATYVGILGSSQASNSSYHLKQSYQGSNFFDGFYFFTSPDPTHGFVNYVDRPTATNMGLISVNNGKIKISSDHTNKISDNKGRSSVRIHSNDQFNDGLFIFDLDHMPTGPGTWPAYWLCGQNWPNNGEIDILEGVDGLNFNSMTLHTNEGCYMPDDGSLFTGHFAKGPQGKDANDCYINAQGQYDNQGCSIQTNNGYFGPQFNAAGGGVFALEWKRNQFMRIWVFKRNEIPSDINQGNPQPQNWGKPTAYFTLGSNCPPSHFNSQEIIINLTFCGDYAGSVYPGGNGACINEVRNNPEAYTEAFWTINYIKVYGN